MTPLRAIRKVCVECVGSSHEVRNCGGDVCVGVQGDEKVECYFFPFRLTKGRPSVKLLRKFCLECQGGSSRLVSECKSDCPLHQYRFGKNPRRAGMGDISRIKQSVSGKKNALKLHHSH